MKVLKLSSSDRQVISVVFSAIPSVGPDELELNNEIIEGLRLDAIVSTTLATGEGDAKVVHNLGPSEIDDVEYVLSTRAYDHLVTTFRAWGRFKGDVEKQKKAAHAWIRVAHPEAKSYAELIEQIGRLETTVADYRDAAIGLQASINDKQIEIDNVNATLAKTIEKSTADLEQEREIVEAQAARILELVHEIDRLRGVEAPKTTMP